MKLIPISAGNMHADGGALFSVIPKVLWQKVYPADEQNRVKILFRCLLVDQDDRKILIEAGPGEHYTEKYMRNHGLIAGNHLIDSLHKAGYSPEEITDVFFTHLHWDHFNGAVMSNKGKLSLTFPNATYWCSKKHWEHSKISNIREKVAFHESLLSFVMDSGQLQLVEKEGNLFPGIDVRFFDGHTPGQMIPFIHSEGKTIVYMSDLIPTAANVPVVWLAAYDLYPVTAMEEKEAFLNEAVENKYILFFEHDFYTECVLIGKNENGFYVDESGNLANFIVS
ncbi:MAG: MBL fold metallo-hydrolase [Prolixibacteraceae bacterium]|nr:MBL fold metallo-hydrolase [Prolixibacteraceae bacterium]